MQHGRNRDRSLVVARALMADFARGTHLEDAHGPAARYLWTDAFAVCNFLALFERTGEQTFLGQALTLVDRVHSTLGRHRRDDTRSGWISGLDGASGRRHPTAGGLRIGKALAERGPGERIDSTLEWQRDGQYFHYLTKWMHALSQAALVTGEARFLLQALELAQVAHRRFTYTVPGAAAPRMYWKLSIDLGRVLVDAMGQHDPLDALVTYRELQRAAARLTPGGRTPVLSHEIHEAQLMCAARDWTTDDPLGIGGLLADAWRVAQMLHGARDDGDDGDAGLVGTLLECADRGLQGFCRTRSLDEPAQQRLAFRELGLCIGLHALARIGTWFDQQPRRPAARERISGPVRELDRYLALRGTIEDFWLDERNRQTPTWTGHRDINTVTLATALLPGGFLHLGGAAPSSSAAAAAVPGR